MLHVNVAVPHDFRVSKRVSVTDSVAMLAIEANLRGLSLERCSRCRDFRRHRRESHLGHLGHPQEWRQNGDETQHSRPLTHIRRGRGVSETHDRGGKNHNKKTTDKSLSGENTAVRIDTLGYVCLDCLSFCRFRLPRTECPSPLRSELVCVSLLHPLC